MYINKFIPIILAAGFFLIVACAEEKPDNKKIKIPGLVPGNFYNATDIHFNKVQDTLFYNNHPFSGYVFALNENKDTSLVMGYLNGLQEGMTKKWYPNKQLAEERLFVHGGKEGTHKGWWENGKLKFVYHFVNDEYEGLVTEWFNTGKMFRQFHYVNGHESGSEKMWWDNGTIRANYVIINGEKFGLSGQKLCVNKNLKLDIK